MFEDLTHALAELEIQPGETRTVRVNDYELEIRRPPAEARSEFEDMVMLEPWVTLPNPPPIATLRVRFACHPLPVAPPIPTEDEA